jgi:predicted TIM-barrel fold metal-dependent hydrolase
MTVTAEGDALGGIQMVDADAHFTEPPDTWSSRVAASRRDKMPQLRTVDGLSAWYLDGELWASTGGNTIRQGGVKILGELGLHPFEEIDPSAWDVSARLALMDSLGIAAQILYPNGVGFSSNHIFAIDDERVRLEILRVYNDFLGDVQEESGGRLYPQALLPIWDMPATILEMTRLLNRGIRGFTFSDRPELLGLPELPDQFYDPMWDLLSESGAVANFHVGAGRKSEMNEDVKAARGLGGPAPVQAEPADRPVPTVAAPYWSSYGIQRRLVIASAQGFMSNVRIIANLCMSDLFDRFPGVRIVSAESGIGWVPFLLESLEYQLDEMVTAPQEVALQRRRPTDYFRDHVYGTFWFERAGLATTIANVGVRNVLVETDIPHPTCTYPGARERFAASLKDTTDYVRQRVLRDNAAELYRLSLPVEREHGT